MIQEIREPFLGLWQPDWVKKCHISISTVTKISGELSY
ncbi:hypothetical protein C789_4592 [Microcystis aeruginosa FACHB-905 = DIANCHI905]|nr:hypothetical protein C789_4592 [Microcystis aeruginosa FACHB-905 = DIANCHI905]